MSGTVQDCRKEEHQGHGEGTRGYHGWQYFVMVGVDLRKIIRRLQYHVVFLREGHYEGQFDGRASVNARPWFLLPRNRGLHTQYGYEQEKKALKMNLAKYCGQKCLWRKCANESLVNIALLVVRALTK